MCKHLLMSWKIKKIKKLEDKIEEKEEKSNKKIKKLETKLKELEDKNKNSTTNKITNNFGKIIIKNWWCKTWKTKHKKIN